MELWKIFDKTMRGVVGVGGRGGGVVERNVNIVNIIQFDCISASFSSMYFFYFKA